MQSNEDHEVVNEIYKLCLARSRAEGRNIFSCLYDAVREDAKLGRRFHAYVFEHSRFAV